MKIMDDNEKAAREFFLIQNWISRLSVSDFLPENQDFFRGQNNFFTENGKIRQSVLRPKKE